MKRISIVLVIMMLLSSLTGCGGSSASSANAPSTSTPSTSTPSTSTPSEPEFSGEIVIGTVANMTSSGSQAGIMQTVGIQMAMDKVNAAGGIQGKKVVLAIEDMGTTTDTVINAVNKLLGRSDISIILGPHTSTNAYAVEGLFRDIDIPFIVGGTNPGLPYTGNENLFCGRANDAIVARAAAKFLVDTVKPKKVGLFCTTEDYGSGGMQTAAKYYDEIGQDYYIESFDGNASDLSGNILKLKNEGCDSLFVWVMTATLLQARQLYEFGMEVPIISCGAATDASVTEVAEPEWFDQWYVACDFVEGNPRPMVGEFARAFRERANLPPDNVAASWYSICDMTLHAMMEYTTDATDPIQVRNALRLVEGFESAAGTYNADTDTQMLFWQTNIVQWQDGEIIFIEAVDGRS